MRLTHFGSCSEGAARECGGCLWGGLLASSTGGLISEQVIFYIKSASCLLVTVNHMNSLKLSILDKWINLSNIE